jgi:excisionase family DNA binding protein
MRAVGGLWHRRLVMEQPARAPACMMTTGDIARLLCVDLKTIHNWVRHGHLRGRRTKGRHLRFHRTEVVRFMRRFGYAVPESLGVAVPRVLLVGIPIGSSPGRLLREYVNVEAYDGLFDAALVVAAGDYEVLVLDLDLFGVGHVVDLVTALRRCRRQQGRRASRAVRAGGRRHRDRIGGRSRGHRALGHRRCGAAGDRAPGHRFGSMRGPEAARRGE